MADKVSMKTVTAPTFAVLSRLVGAALLTGLAACSQGRDFTRPDLDGGLQLGITTEAEVVARYGQPLARSAAGETVTRSPMGPMPREQSAFIYGYVGGLEIGPKPRSVRVAIFGFKDGKLRTAVFASTFVADQRDFEPAAVSALLLKPSLTRADLVAALGPPEGRVADPAGHYAERDGWYVLGSLPNENGGPLARIAPIKVLTADIAADGGVIAHKFEVENAL